MTRSWSPAPTPEAALAALDEATRNKLVAYRPASLSDEELRVLDVVLFDVLGWVAMARPQNAGVACYLTRFVLPLAIWTYTASGECSAETVFDAKNVEFWAMARNSAQVGCLEADCPLGGEAGGPGSVSGRVAPGTDQIGSSLCCPRLHPRRGAGCSCWPPG